VRRLTLIVLALLLLDGCMYRIGRNAVDGALDEAIGEDRVGGVDALGDRILQKQLALELGKQLGEGVASGATELTVAQREQIEATIDGILMVTTERGAHGIRTNLSPALRDLVRQDIVDALADGMKERVSPQLEDTADRVVTRAIVSLRKGLDDPETRIVLSELIADSFYIAMREGGGRSPAVSDTIEATMTQSVLSPVEESAGSIADQVALKIDEQAHRTEQTLQAIIIFLGAVLIGFVVLYAFVQRQLARERATSREAEQGLRQVSAVIGLLDEGTRNKLQGVLGDSPAAKSGAPLNRRDDYERRDDPAPKDDARHGDYERKK
jgi:hypothetical protein